MSPDDPVLPMLERLGACSPAINCGDCRQVAGGHYKHRLVRPAGRVICRFSCGAASAVATKLAIEKYGTVEIYYSDTGSEHDYNARFIADCELWFGQKITTTRSEKYADIWQVFESKRFIVSHQGAPCTAEMKRKPVDKVWKIGDTEIFGYTVEERQRVEKWKRDNFERIIECPLIEKNLTKQDCFGILDRVGIELPAMYRLGFRNNNCIGCVKARDNLDYWKRVRKHFPAIFERMAKLERDIGTNINRITKNGERSPIFLDEIEEGDPKGADPNIQCGLFCIAEANAMIDGPTAGNNVSHLNADLHLGIPETAMHDEAVEEAKKIALRAAAWKNSAVVIR